MRASRRFPISLLPIVYIIRYMSSRLSNDDEREPNEHCEQIANTDSSFVKRMLRYTRSNPCGILDRQDRLVSKDVKMMPVGKWVKFIFFKEDTHKTLRKGIFILTDDSRKR